MKIIIKTPLLNNSRYAAHLVEHCMFRGNKKSISEYALLDYDLTGVTQSWYTVFDVHDDLWKSFLQNNILKSLDQGSYKIEKKIISDENTESDYRKDLEERLWREIYGDSFSLKRWARSVTFEIAKKYHKDNYINWNILVYTDSYNELIWSQNKKQNTIIQTKLEANELMFWWDSYWVVYQSMYSWKIYYLYMFMDTLFNLCFSWNSSINESKYFHNNSWFFVLYNYIALTFPKDEKFVFSDELFNATKIYILEQMKDRELLLGASIFKLYLDQNISKWDIYEYIKNIDENIVIEIINLLQNKN